MRSHHLSCICLGLLIVSCAQLKQYAADKAKESLEEAKQYAADRVRETIDDATGSLESPKTEPQRPGQPPATATRSQPAATGQSSGTDSNTRSPAYATRSQPAATAANCPDDMVLPRGGSRSCTDRARVSLTDYAAWFKSEPKTSLPTHRCRSEPEVCSHGLNPDDTPAFAGRYCNSKGKVLCYGYVEGSLDMSNGFRCCLDASETPTPVSQPQPVAPAPLASNPYGGSAKAPVVPPQPVTTRQAAECPEWMTNIAGLRSNICVDAMIVLFKDYETWCNRSRTCSTNEFPESCLRLSANATREQFGVCMIRSRESGLCSLGRSPYREFCVDPDRKDPFNPPKSAQEYCRSKGKVLCDDSFANGALRSLSQSTRKELGFRCCLALR